MSTACAALGNTAQPVTIDYNGKRYTIRGVDAAMIAELERWLIQRDVATRTATYQTAVKAGLMTADEAVAKLEVYSDDLTKSGRYAYGSQEMNLALFGQKSPPTPAEMERQAKKTPEEIAAEATDLERATVTSKFRLFSLMLNCSVDEVYEIYAAKREELLAKINIAYGESMPAPKGDAPRES